MRRLKISPDHFSFTAICIQTFDVQIFWFPLKVLQDITNFRSPFVVDDFAYENKDERKNISCKRLLLHMRYVIFNIFSVPEMFRMLRSFFEANKLSFNDASLGGDHQLESFLSLYESSPPQMSPAGMPQPWVF